MKQEKKRRFSVSTGVTLRVVAYSSCLLLDFSSRSSSKYEKLSVIRLTAPLTSIYLRVYLDRYSCIGDSSTVSSPGVQSLCIHPLFLRNLRADVSPRSSSLRDVSGRFVSFHLAKRSSAAMIERNVCRSQAIF